ncbi:MAG: MBOAT family O-acyltransferase [Ignavibacteria bacterium]|nr:MBOAT family O-acyltransferase [Ignavibacteria bacterium]
MSFAIDWDKLLNLFLYNPRDPILFGSSFFLFFFALVLFFQFSFRNNTSLRIYSLILLSVFFYYKASGGYVMLLFFVTMLNYFSGKLLFQSKNPTQKNIIFTISIIINLSLLAYFKYTNFFIQIINDLHLGNLDALQIFLPIGISFFTFRAMSYLIEIYYEFIEPTDSFRDFTLFIFFFPTVLMGPIDRSSTFLPQIKESLSVSRASIGIAVFLLSTGLIKKFVIADYVNLNFTSRVFEFPNRFTGTENLLAVYANALQSYCDFSGYTDMALGIGLLLGFQLTENFNRPFKATSVADYWRRWHLSLSNWLLDFVFKPVNVRFRRFRKLGLIIAITTTFFCVGLWHGPNWTFIIFGLLHSFYLVFSMLTQKLRDSFYKKIGIKKNRLFRFFQIVFTLHLLVFTALLFKAPSVSDAFIIVEQIFTFLKPEVFPQFILAYPEIFGLIIFGYVIHFLPDSLELKTKELMSKLPIISLAIILTLIIWIVIQVKSAGMQPFIYFKF